MSVGHSSSPSGYAVASAHPLATNAGLEILAKGGNAFDAAVAVSAALAVVEPYHSGLGGGGFWLLHIAKENKNLLIDGREVAPQAATKNMFLDDKGNLIPQLSLNGGLAAAIPGEPAALALMAKQFGKLPLKVSLAPAIRLAEEGFVVDHQLYSFITMSDRLEQFKKHPATAAVFTKQGQPYSIGEKLKQPDLGKTLRIIAEKGHDGFYKGEVAQQLVTGVNQSGGIWDLKDLAAYQAKIREPLEGKFHNLRIITSPLPSAGGVALITMLNIIAQYPLETFTESQRIHYLVEAMRLAYWQRGELADPDFVKVPLAFLVSAKNASCLQKRINPNRVTPSSSLTKVNCLPEESNTTHFSILDKEGNRVAATLSINYIFGSSVVAPGTGVLLNDEMDDFTTKPAALNVFGLMGNEKNCIEPGKRPLSSMTPTFLESPERVAIFGTPGGSRIPTMILLATLAFDESYGAITMVSKMRFHHQYMPDWLVFEPDTFSPSLQKTLKEMGYKLYPLNQYYGDMQAITWDKKEHLITAASDPRHIGEAAVIVSSNEGGYGLTH